MNRLKTTMLLAALTALLLWAGQAVGGAGGFWFALAVAAMMDAGAYWFGDRIVLRMYQAQEVTPEAAPELHGMVRELAMRANLPAPRVYVIPEQAPNALATGRDPGHGVVAVTEGLLRNLDRREIAGVIAHELGHIKHRDTLIMTVAATRAGALSMLANAAMWGMMSAGRSSDEEEGGSAWGGLLGVVIAPVAAMLVQRSISRTREFHADEASARISGVPLVLASALQKIERASQQLPMHQGSPATAHLFIQNPFGTGGLMRLFSTHPPTEARVARLEEMANGRTPMAA